MSRGDKDARDCSHPDPSGVPHPSTAFPWGTIAQATRASEPATALMFNHLETDRADTIDSAQGGHRAHIPFTYP